jgi:hypothetical protein
MPRCRMRVEGYPPTQPRQAGQEAVGTPRSWPTRPLRLGQGPSPRLAGVSRSTRPGAMRRCRYSLRVSPSRTLGSHAERGRQVVASARPSPSPAAGPRRRGAADRLVAPAGTLCSGGIGPGSMRQHLGQVGASWSASFGRNAADVTRIAGDVRSRQRSPAMTAQPRSSSAVTTAVSCATGTQTCMPERPWPVIPCSASALISARRVAGRCGTPQRGSVTTWAWSATPSVAWSKTGPR